MGCHFLLQGIFPTQEADPCVLHWEANSLLLSHLGSPPLSLVMSFYACHQHAAKERSLCTKPPEVGGRKSANNKHWTDGLADAPWFILGENANNHWSEKHAGPRLSIGILHKPGKEEL